LYDYTLCYEKGRKTQQVVVVFLIDKMKQMSNIKKYSLFIYPFIVE